MKIDRAGGPPFIIGKRVTLAALSATIVVAVIGYFPEQAALIRAAEAIVVFGVQIWVANKYGVTT